MDKTIKIIDTTLREGLQTQGTKLNLAEAVEIAQCLVQLGVDMIECGHPASGEAEVDMVRAVVNAAGTTPVLAHSRARISDIEMIFSTGATWVGIFAGINDLSTTARIRTEKLLATVIEESIQFARQNGLLVRFTIEDATRTPPKRLLEFFRVAIDAGANRICIADSVGCICPWDFEALVKEIHEFTGSSAELEVHCHDDRGLSMANALTAIRHGATWISSSINGIGERCGITDTITLLANLAALNVRTKVNGQLLQYASLLVQAHTRNPVDRTRPVTGDNASTHVAKLHKRAVRANPSAYAWTNQEDMGKRTILDPPALPLLIRELINMPSVIGSSELKFHRDGVGDRYLMIDDRVVPDCRQYCIVRDIPNTNSTPAAHVDDHRHVCDSLFIFLGRQKGLTGLKVEVTLGTEVFAVESPCSVFIPSGMLHSYRIILGSGFFINHVLKGNYNDSLLEKFEHSMNINRSVVDTFLSEHCSGVLISETDELSDVLDSLTFLDLFIYLENHFGEKISLDKVTSCRTLGDLNMYISYL